jgi:hypothetical protein
MAKYLENARTEKSDVAKTRKERGYLLLFGLAFGVLLLAIPQVFLALLQVGGWLLGTAVLGLACMVCYALFFIVGSIIFNLAGMKA